MRTVVTGAASGIGRATAQLLLQRGAQVLLVDLREDRLTEIAAELGVEGSAPTYFACDITSAEQCQALAEFAEESFTAIDALVHCAGILRPPGGKPQPLHMLEESEYEAVVGTNLKGTFLINRALLNKMLAHKRGQIVNVSSTSGLKGRPLDSLYSASKAGVIGLTESIAEEVRAFGIRAQVVIPDAVDTPLWQQNGPMPMPPPGSLPAVRVAEVIAMCLSLPPDATCQRMVIEPFGKGRSRKKTKET